MGAQLVEEDEARRVEGGARLAPGGAGRLAPLGGCHWLLFRVQPRRWMARLMVAALTSTPWAAC
jgi:hypothetical protein